MKKFFSGKQLILTLLVPLAAAVMIRLGFWQLQRLEERRAYNHQVQTMTAAEPLVLSGKALSGGDPGLAGSQLGDWEYRSIEVTGSYDHTGEIVIRNQAWDHQPGVHVLTPLMIDGTEQAVLVDRGWLPLAAYQNGTWKEHREPGSRVVQGMIRLPQTDAPLGGQSNPEPEPGEFLTAWYFVDLEAIESQLPYPLLPVYVQEVPEDGNQDLPYAARPDFELTEGPHLGYAVQWFGFAAAVSIGYPIYVIRKSEGE